MSSVSRQGERARLGGVKTWSWTTLLSLEARIGQREMIWIDSVICKCDGMRRSLYIQDHHGPTLDIRQSSCFVPSSGNLQNTFLQPRHMYAFDAVLSQLCNALVGANKLLWLLDSKVDLLDSRLPI